MQNLNTPLRCRLLTAIAYAKKNVLMSGSSSSSSASPSWVIPSYYRLRKGLMLILGRLCVFDVHGVLSVSHVLRVLDVLDVLDVSDLMMSSTDSTTNSE